MRSFFSQIFLIFFLCQIIPGELPASVPLNHSETDLSGPYRKLAEFSRLYPQQKAYLHTDKNEYLAGETIWMKAYLVSARSHVPDTLSTNLFVEFINTRHEVVEFLIMRLEKGFSSGSIQLPDSLPGGNYQLKAYTNWMRNFPRLFLFSKDIYVYNSEETNYVSRAEIRQNTRFNSMLSEKQETMQIAFFPEGGNLVAGLENRVAFKAVDALGKGRQASGTLLDGKGQMILQFETYHDGMGLFSFTPNPGEIYSAQILFEGGQRINKALPPAFSQGYRLKVEPSTELIRVSVKTNFDPEALNLSPDILLLAHTRGRVGYIERASLIEGAYHTSISPGQFPGGITHFTLFGPSEIPLAERLVFVNEAFQGEFGSKVAWEKRSEDGLVVVDFWFDPSNGLSPADNNLSLAVTEKFSQDQQSDINIASYLLLSSDFGSTIHDPMYFFTDHSPERLKALDLLMMTHGWRRFDWNELLAGKFPEILYKEPRGLSIVGKVTPVSSAHETGELNIEMSVGVDDQRDILRSKTDLQGIFSFSGLDYEGLFTALVSVGRDRRGRTFRVDFFGLSSESSQFKPTLSSREHLAVFRGPEWKRRQQPNFFKRLFNRPLTGQETRSHGMYGKPDQVIYMEDLITTYSNVFDVIRDRVVGLNVINGEITLRGVSSIRLSNEPLYFIDEVLVNRFSFLNIPVSEVERIEVLKGPSAAILGSRGANGALFIYTRRAIHHQQFNYEFHLKGYHAPSEFYFSRINVQKYADNMVPRTILWAPNIVPDINGRVRVRIPYPFNADNLNFRLEGIDLDGQITFIQF